MKLSADLKIDETEDFSVSEFIDDITPTISKILSEQFPNDLSRQTLRVHGKNRIQFCCPVCGDSADSSKKRGNIILDGKYKNHFKCFNCGAYMSIDKFFDRYKKSISMTSLDYIIKNKNNISYSAYNSELMNSLYNVEEIESLAINKQYLIDRLNLTDVSITNCYGRSYLINRNQFDFNKFLYRASDNSLYILNLTPSNKVLGLQIRTLMDKIPSNVPKYKTYTLSNIYKMLLNEDKEISESIDNLSQIFNILLVDITKDVIALEGPLDSFLIKNSIALTGANKHTPLDIPFSFLFDDDETGKKNAFTKLNDGYKVFLWENFKEDMNLPYRKKWDINDVVNYCKEHNITFPSLFKYFSNDKFDLIDI